MKKFYLFCSALIIFIIIPHTAGAVGKVKDLTVVSTSYNQVELDWDKVNHAERYQVRVLVKIDGDYQLVKKVRAAKSKKTVTDLSAETTYYFKVRAYNNGAYGEYSKRKHTTTPAAPVVEDPVDPDPVEPTDPTDTARAAVQGTLASTNSSGRHGTYYLPAGYNLEAKPVAIMYHGTGGDGAEMLNWFSSLAAQYDFIIIAPDSRISPSGEYIWEVGTADGEITEDYTYTLTCLAEVDAMEYVSFDAEHVLAAGFSAGGSSAPYIATNEDFFTHYAILHGGVYPSGLGDNVIAGWISTGEDDTLRTPEHEQQNYDDLVAAGYPDITLRTYSGGHTLSDSERSEMLLWWLY